MGVNLSLPEGWEEMTDPESGKKYYYNSSSGESTWDKPKGNKPEGLDFGTAGRVAAAAEKWKQKADTNLAFKSYNDPEDSGRLALIRDLKEQGGANFKGVDDRAYVAQSPQGHSNDYQTSWLNPKNPEYSREDGQPFIDTEEGQPVQVSKIHPSRYPGHTAGAVESKMGGGRRRRTRKKRAGWRTPEKGSPMRTLYTKENKKRKKTKKKKNKRKKRKRRELEEEETEKDKVFI